MNDRTFWQRFQRTITSTVSSSLAIEDLRKIGEKQELAFSDSENFVALAAATDVVAAKYELRNTAKNLILTFLEKDGGVVIEIKSLGYAAKKRWSDSRALLKVSETEISVMLNFDHKGIATAFDPELKIHELTGRAAELTRLS